MSNPPAKTKPPVKTIPNHFTSTGPYAGSKPNPRTTTIPVPPGPSDETPQQRVARLRRTAAVARDQNVHWQDRVVDRGRVWADRAHRTTTWSLIGFTGIAAVVCGYALFDMARYNRKKRNKWFQEQQALRQENLKIALRAQGRGTATDEQMLLINQYRAIQEAEEARVKNRGAFGKSMDWLFPGVKSKQQEANVLGAIEATVDDELFKAIGNLPSSASEAQPKQMKASPEGAKSIKASATGPVGGPLDRQANKLTEAAEGTTKSWMSWLSTR